MCAILRNFRFPSIYFRVLGLCKKIRFMQFTFVFFLNNSSESHVNRRRRNAPLKSRKNYKVYIKGKYLLVVSTLEKENPFLSSLFHSVKEKEWGKVRLALLSAFAIVCVRWSAKLQHDSRLQVQGWVRERER